MTPASAVYLLDGLHSTLCHPNVAWFACSKVSLYVHVGEGTGLCGQGQGENAACHDGCLMVMTQALCKQTAC